uniref:Uncharacterized protein n=1 Tax=Lepeophtheirus salmonis TaxID=72036 RepID=A0A0K2SXE9_LEPSM
MKRIKKSILKSKTQEIIGIINEQIDAFLSFDLLNNLSDIQLRLYIEQELTFYHYLISIS